jgi:hypothetical protein
MPDTLTHTNQPSLSALVELVAAADAAGEMLVSSSRLVDVLLDVRNDADPAAVEAVDVALAACAHRSVVPTDEAVELAAGVTAAVAGEASPVDVGRADETDD